MIHAVSGPLASGDAKALLETIAADFADPLPRLVFADYLDHECGMGERAALVRYEAGPASYPVPQGFRTASFAEVINAHGHQRLVGPAEGVLPKAIAWELIRQGVTPGHLNGSLLLSGRLAAIDQASRTILMSNEAWRQWQANGVGGDCATMTVAGFATEVVATTLVGVRTALAGLIETEPLLNPSGNRLSYCVADWLTPLQQGPRWLWLSGGSWADRSLRGVPPGRHSFDRAAALPNDLLWQMLLASGTAKDEDHDTYYRHCEEQRVTTLRTASRGDALDLFGVGLERLCVSLAERTARLRG